MMMLLHIIITICLVQILNAYPTEPNSVELSFKQLESGESSGEVVNQCCQRESKYITVGHGISAGEVKFDVGQCRQKCPLPTVKPLKREEFDKYLRTFPDMDPIQIFLNLRSSTSVQTTTPSSPPNENVEDSGNQNKSPNTQTMSTSCLQSLCIPNSVKRESYYDLSGEVKEIDVIESCDCVSQPQRGCHRYPSVVKIHVDTPYEREVDIGQCLGPCDDNLADHSLFCRPVRNRTISLEGPNGAYCLSVIEECECVGKCYRVRQFLKVYDYTHVFAAKANLLNTLYNSSASINNSIAENRNRSMDTIPEMAQLSDSSSLGPLTKVIDIGRCSGSCSVPMASKCLLWSSTNNGTCLSMLTGGTSKCNATKFVSHAYMDMNGKKHTIVSVTGCGCR